MDINDSLNLRDNESDVTLQEQESMLWIPRESAELLSDRNVRLSTARSGTGTARDILVQKNWLIIIMVNTISTAFLMYFMYS